MDNNFSRLFKHLVNIVNNHQLQCITYRFDFQDLFSHMCINLVVNNHSRLNKHLLCNLFHLIHILCTEDSKYLKYHKCIMVILFLLLLPLLILNLVRCNFDRQCRDQASISQNHLMMYIIYILDFTDLFNRIYIIKVVDI